MKRKKLFLLLVIIALCVVALIIWIINKPKEYKPEIIEPEVFEDETFDSDLLIGLWKSGTVFYRYNADGSGITWDTADDVMESEGSKFTWEINKKQLFHYHRMEISNAIIPKTYNINNLDLVNLDYSDDYNVKSSFVKVE